MLRFRINFAGLLRRVEGRAGLMGAIWSSVNAGAGVALPFLVFIFFAHVLMPAQIGLIVLGVSCAEFVKAIGLSGLYEALLQQSTDRQRYHETALAVLLLSGFVLLGVYAGMITLLARTIDGVATTYFALLAIGLRVPLDLATLQPQAILAQRLSYRRMAIRAIIANAGAGAVGIGLALTGRPMAGMIVYQVGQSALILLTTVIGTAALARPRLHRDCLRRMAHEATMSSIVRLVAATNNYVDQIIIAAMLSSTRLAYFNLAKRVETTFITASASFSAILFQPLFATTDAASREPVLRKGLATLTLLCGLPVTFLMINGDRIVPLVFGASWTPAAPVVGLLAIGGLLRALGSVHGALLSVSGRNRQLAVMSTVSALTGIVGVAVTARYGVVWCAAALTVKNLAITLWLAVSTRRDVSHMARAYLIEVIVPLALMLSGAAGGRLIAGATLSSAAPATTIAVLTVSILAGAGGGLISYARRLLRTAPASVPVNG
jgi:PST family polysaccharide transporter